MSEDRSARWATQDQSDTQPTQRRGPARGRPKAVPVRRAPAKSTQAVQPAYDVTDAHTDVLPVMTDEEFEDAVRTARERTAQARDAVKAEPQEQEPVDEAEEPPAPTPKRRRSVLGGFSGALTAGTVIIALATIAAQVLSSTHGKPGPGALDVAGQAVFAILAILLQRVVDRRRGVRRWSAAFGVLVVTAASFGIFWWAWLWLFWPV